MGNDVSRPSPKLIKNVDHFRELTSSKLKDIREASEFWRERRSSLVGKADFDEIFGHIFKDSDIYFQYFCARGKNVVGPHLVWLMLALFCSDSPYSKWLYFYELYFQGEEASLESVLMNCFSDILEGLFFLFDISPPPLDILGDIIEMCVKKFRASKSVGYEKVEAQQVEIGDFVQIIQENHTICKYADAILSLCTPPQTASYSTVFTASILTESKLMRESNRVIPRPRHPLWRFTILDMFEESWLQSLPIVSTNTSVFTLLENLFSSKKPAAPVYHPGTSHRTELLRLESTSVVSEMNESEANFKESLSQSSDMFTLFAIVDELTILLWLAESCPKNVLGTSSASVPTAADRRKSSFLQQYENRRQSSRMGSNVHHNLMFSTPALANRSRRTSYGGSVHNQWQENGVKFASTSVSSVLAVPKSEQEPKSVGISTSGHFPESISLNNPPPKSGRCELLYSAQHIFQTDQFIYNVMELYAKGYRNIPVASSRLEPFKDTMWCQTVSQVITGSTLAAFLRLYAHEILGILALTTIEESGLMRKPILVHANSHFGAAIQVMSQRVVESCAIVDDLGRWCGRLESKCISEFWWAWRELIMRSGKGTKCHSREEIRKAYSRGCPETIDVSGISNFSIFSMLLSPLKECESIGIHITDFEEFMSEKPPIIGLAERLEESDSDESSESDDDDDDATESSSKSDLDFSPLKSPTNLVPQQHSDQNQSAKNKLSRWFREMKLVQTSDTIGTALEVMYISNSSKAFVANTAGEVVGVLCVRDLVKTLLDMEKRQQANRHGV